MGTLPRTMVRIIDLLRGAPQDRAGIAGALKLRENITAAVLMKMQYRRIVRKEGDCSLAPRRRTEMRQTTRSTR
jgi:hypothetical protein